MSDEFDKILKNTPDEVLDDALEATLKQMSLLDLLKMISDIVVNYQRLNGYATEAHPTDKILEAIQDIAKEYVAVLTFMWLVDKD